MWRHKSSVTEFHQWLYSPKVPSPIHQQSGWHIVPNDGTSWGAETAVKTTKGSSMPPAQKKIYRVLRVDVLFYQGNGKGNNEHCSEARRTYESSCYNTIHSF